MEKENGNYYSIYIYIFLGGGLYAEYMSYIRIMEEKIDWIYAVIVPVSR